MTTHKSYQLIVFDWEGTLADTLGEYFSVIAEEANKLHLPAFDINIARSFVMFGLNKALIKLYPNISPKDYEALLYGVQRTLASRTQKPSLMQGAYELLQSLHTKGMRLAIASNKGQASLKRAIENAGIDQFVTITRSASECAPKPSPEMLEAILACTAVDPSAAVMIGDSVNDIEMAQAIGVDALGIDVLQENREALLAAGAMMVFNDFASLARFLQSPKVEGFPS